MSIAEKVLDCVKAYQKLNIDITDKFTQHDVEEQTNGAFIAKVNESFERFQLWSSNMGAHRKDRNSLDQRLWEASNLRNQVLQYLEDLQQGFADVSAIINGTTEPWDQFSDSSSEEDDQDDIETSTELEQLVAYIGNTIDCLLRISLVIQKPAPHDRFIKSGRFDQSFRQPWDVQHVREKFANIPDWLSERLGKANSRRRQFLEYRQAHHERIARVEIADAMGDTGTVVSSLPTLLRQHQELWTSATPELPEADIQSDTGVSETSYAETIADEHALFVPTMPEAAQRGAVFECPHCFMLVRGIYNRLQWKRHVFADLQPYVCLYQDCLSADETFSRRHKWIQHHKHFHLKIWRCNLGCPQTFSSKSDTLDHIADVHELQGHTDIYLQALSVEIQHDQPEQLLCPLCRDTLSSHRKWHKHVAHHLEQLALFVIPRDKLEGKDREESGSESDQAEKDQQSIASTRLDSDERASEDLEKQISDDEHINVLVNVANEALTYHRSGRYKEAEELQKQVIDSRKTLLGQDHPSTLDAMAELVSIYSSQTRYVEAEALLHHILERRKIVIGEDQPSTLDVMAELANLYSNQQRHVEARELMFRVLERRKLVLGENHRSTIRTASRLAEMYTYQGQYEKAEELQKQTVERCMATLGENNIDTLDSISEMSHIYRSGGKYKEAKELTKRVGEKYKTLLGENHTSTIGNAADLVLVYICQGRHKEAEELQKQVVERYKAVLGEDDPVTLYNMYRLAYDLESQGWIAEAIDLMEQVAQRRSERACGPEDVIYVACISTLSKWRARHAEAI